jgi:hypothetical protein
MNNITQLNSQRPDPVSSSDLTNWGGQDVSAQVFPEFKGKVGNEIVDEVEDLIDEWVFLTPQDRTLLTLWIGHANAFRWFRFTPCLGITAGDAECGKSQALLTCRMLTNNSLWIGDASGASFFTQTQHGDKAVFLDEMQDMIGSKDSKTLLAALKTGRQSNGYVTRVDTSNGRNVRRFATHAAVGFDGIGVDRKVDSQMHTRTHWIAMRKAFTCEQRELLDERFEEERFADVGSRYFKWIIQSEQEIKSYKTDDLPKFIVNRGRQKWLPLFAIANLLGGKWIAHLEELAADDTALEELNDGTQALLALQTINEEWATYSPSKPRDSKIAANDAAELMLKWKDENGVMPYQLFHSGYSPDEKKLIGKDLFGLLRPFGVKTKNNRSRFNPDDRSSGFEWADILDSADRHLPERYRIGAFRQAETPDKEVSYD